jgi:hypothetical protein
MHNQNLRALYLEYRNSDTQSIELTLLYAIYQEFNKNKDLTMQPEEFKNNFTLYNSTGAFNSVIFNSKFDRIFEIVSISDKDKIIKYV